VTTRETVERYFDVLRARGSWESWLADDLAFTVLASPPRTISGKAAFLQATRNFYSMIAECSVRELVAEGDRAIALTRYRLQPPNGASAFDSDVAEAFRVRDGKIAGFQICFDTAPYPK
jgi:ketosteroid isomerase-like protein